MSNNLRFVEKLANAPWLCDPEHVEFLHSIFLRYLDRAAAGEPFDRRAIEEAVGRPLDNTRAVTIRDGVARIPVEGTIVRRASLFTDISGGVSTETLAKDFVTAHNDPRVHSILFVFDSPGGEAYGVNELAGMVRAKRDLKEKRIEAYCEGDCASAAYWIASATSKITTDATAALGAIGVVTRVRNPEAAGKSRTLEFWNARSPRKRVDPTTGAGKATIQAWIDDMGDEFIAAVARNRGVAFEEVERDFGRGFVMTGRRAVEVGLADALGSEEEAIAALVESRRSPPAALAAAASASRAHSSVAASAATDGAGPNGSATATSVTEDEVVHREEPHVSEKATEQATNFSNPPAAEESPEGIVARIRGILGMAPAEAQDQTYVTNNTSYANSTAAPTASATAQGPHGEEGATDAIDEFRAEALGADEGGEGTGEERTEGMTDSTDAARVGGGASTEELEQLRAELEAERAERSKTTSILRDQGIEQMLQRKASVTLGNGKRGVMPPAQRNAARSLIGALEAAGADVIDLSPTGEASIKDTDAGKAVNALLTPWKPVELGERGSQEAAAESGGAEGDHERIMATLAERGLGADQYEAVAGELAARGEIRREG